MKKNTYRLHFAGTANEFWEWVVVRHIIVSLTFRSVSCNLSVLYGNSLRQLRSSQTGTGNTLGAITAGTWNLISLSDICKLVVSVVDKIYPLFSSCFVILSMRMHLKLHFKFVFTQHIVVLSPQELSQQMKWQMGLSQWTQPYPRKRKRVRLIVVLVCFLYFSLRLFGFPFLVFGFSVFILFYFFFFCILRVISFRLFNMA